MTRRERTLAFLLLPPLILIGGGFIAHQMWYEPLVARDRRIEDLNREIEEKISAVKKAQEKKKELDRINLLSLPREVELARREYEEQLSKMVRASGFDSQSITITSKKPDARTAPVLMKGQPPIYTRLEYTLQAKGELICIVDFMEKFYDVPLLHQIRNLKIQRPTGSGTGNRPTFDLDYVLTIEALVLDRADPRKTLLPEKPPTVPPLLARGERKYSAIAGRDLFYGPPPATPVVRQDKPTSSADFAQFVKFDGYTDGDKGPVITLWDAFNSNEQTIRPDGEGGYKVEVKYLLNGRKRTLRSGKTIDVMDENGELQHRWLVLRANEREVYLQDEEFYYVLHIGQWLSEMHKLTTEEAAGLGLIAPKPKEPEKPTDGDGKAEKPEKAAGEK
ncbi:MAG: hypothetical protein K1X57_00240 [Gemmataceae bacterium]|nr:hypothetical protein [Gemmataceae bacterium]